MNRRPLLVAVAVIIGTISTVLSVAAFCSQASLAAPPSSPTTGAAGAPASELRVCAAGAPTCTHTTIQAAVDAAAEGDIIKVAAGVYTDIHVRRGITQVVYLTKSITIRGGYTITGWTTSDPEANPTILDAQGRGRVLYIAGQGITPVIEGLHLTGGNATGLKGSPYGTTDVGGGLYILDAMATVSGCRIYSNTTPYYGGGIYLYRTSSRILHNTISGNSANYGGGIGMESSDAVIEGNSLLSNRATRSGGGIYVSYGSPVIRGNSVLSNTASLANGGGGFLANCNALLYNNIIASNNASQGGGLYVSYCSTLSIGNSVLRNNYASYGGSLYLVGSPADLYNNLIADNRATNHGAGVYVTNAHPVLRHTTLARNRGLSGVYVAHTSEPSHVVLTNTIVVSHALGIFVTAGDTVTLRAVLWGTGNWANTVNAGGSGSVVTIPPIVSSEPGFSAPELGNYHLGAGSAAIDAGIDAGIRHDIDGEPRPARLGYDLGADEFPGAALRIHKTASQPAFNAGDTVNYTVTIENIGTEVAQELVVTDTVSVYQQVITATSGQGLCLPLDTSAVCTVSDLAPGAVVTIQVGTRVSSTTVPGPLPFRIRNYVEVLGTNATGALSQDYHIHDCYARVNGSEYTYLQHAVNAAAEGETVLVAGLCSGPAMRGGTSQVVYIDKGITLKGGYSPDFTVWDPRAYPTTIDAVGMGRGMYLVGHTGSLIEAIEVTNGNPSGSLDEHIGGGIYVLEATSTIRDCHVYSNTAASGGGIGVERGFVSLHSNLIEYNQASTHGGGLLLTDSDAELDSNVFYSNAAGGNGGGLAVSRGTVNLTGDHLVGNFADDMGGGLRAENARLNMHSVSVLSNTTPEGGGGMSLYPGSVVTLTGSTVGYNTAAGGGGIDAWQAILTISESLFLDNMASSSGGGLLLSAAPTVLSGNTFHGNSARGTATLEGGGGVRSSGPISATGNTFVGNEATNRGGGLYLSGSQPVYLNGNSLYQNVAGAGGGAFLRNSYATLVANIIYSNTVSGSGGGLSVEGGAPSITWEHVFDNSADRGGGIYLTNSAALLVGNQVGWNSATYGGGVAISGGNPFLDGNIVSNNTASQQGGGLHISSNAAPRLVNNVVLMNEADVAGSGICVSNASVPLWHTTIHANSTGAGTGLYIESGSVALTNTIFAGHTAALDASAGTTATLNGVLYYDNFENVVGAGYVTATHVYTGDPAFAADGFHITEGSAAIDRGVAGVDHDIDGESRPSRLAPDLGADEYLDVVYGVILTPTHSTRSGIPGSSVLHTLRVANAGTTTDTFAVSSTEGDFLLAFPRQIGPLPAGGDATLGVLAEIPAGAPAGSVDTADIIVTSLGDRRRSASASLSTIVNRAYGLAVDVATPTRSGDPGSTVTYTIRVTNTGNTADVFNISVAHNLWDTVPTPSTLGPLEAGEYGDVSVSYTHL
ncbi:MAG: hypothetical protein N2508_02805, partial [Anaerolineae bacterium]|nr:hypothetical protein [Anaerolineae bacterium]